MENVLSAKQCDFYYVKLSCTLKLNEKGKHDVRYDGALSSRALLVETVAIYLVASSSVVHPICSMITELTLSPSFLSLSLTTVDTVDNVFLSSPIAPKLSRPLLAGSLGVSNNVFV